MFRYVYIGLRGLACREGVCRFLTGHCEVSEHGVSRFARGSFCIALIAHTVSERRAQLTRLKDPAL